MVVLVLIHLLAREWTPFKSNKNVCFSSVPNPDPKSSPVGLGLEAAPTETQVRSSFNFYLLPRTVWRIVVPGDDGSCTSQRKFLQVDTSPRAEVVVKAEVRRRETGFVQVPLAFFKAPSR